MAWSFVVCRFSGLDLWHSKYIGTPSWNSQQVFCLLYVLFYQYIKSPLACWMKHSQGRIPSLSFDNTSFKATCNPQSQLIGEACLQIYFGSKGFRHQWAVTPPVKITYLGTVIFNFLATLNTSGPTPVSGTGMLPLQKDHCYPSGGCEGVYVEWPDGIS